MRAIFQNKAVPLYIFFFFRNTFVQYVTVWLVRIWAYKNADEKEHTFSWRTKNVQKRTKVDKERILCKSTFTGAVWGILVYEERYPGVPFFIYNL